MLIYGICMSEIKDSEIDWDKVEKLLESYDVNYDDYSPVRRSRLYPTIWRKLMNVQSKNTPGYSTKKSWLIKLRKFVDNWRI